MLSLLKAMIRRKLSNCRVLFCIILTFILLACEKEEAISVSVPPRIDIVLTRNETEVLESGKAFSFDLFRNVVNEQESGNVIVSPLSVHVALNMLANGATGETLSQIKKTLGYDNCSIEDLNSAYSSLIEGLKKVDTSTDLYSANSLWIDKGIPVADDYSNRLSSNYAAFVSNIDLHSGKAEGIINEWCRKQTNGFISNASPRIMSETVMLLVNASYFNGKWKDPFYVQSTRQSEFRTLDGTVVMKSFMKQANKHLFGESEDGKVKMCELPFGNGAFVMDIVLPDSTIVFKDFIKELSAEQWDSLFSYKAVHNINLSLPKFKFEFECDLKNTLISLGLGLMYDRKNADFSLISKDSGLFVSSSTQKTFIEIDEKGAKAAAVTTHKGDVNLLYSPGDTIDFIADHPFLFIIREITSDTIIHIGTIIE